MDFDEIPEPYRRYARTKKQTKYGGVTYYAINGDTPEEKLKTLFECNCCERHQINKPLTLGSGKCKTNKVKINNKSCLCDCRHLARILCTPC